MFQKIILIAALYLAGLSSASAQLVVESRPEAPEQRQQLPAPKDDSYVRISGEWVEKDGEYRYVQPRYVKQPVGKKYVAGKWKKAEGGWTWRTGYWK